MSTTLPGAGRRGTTAVLVALALVAGGCGLRGEPSVSSEEQVVASMVALGEQSRLTQLSASIEVDEGELRTLVREQPALLDLLAPEEGEAPLDVDELIATVRETQATLDRVAMLAGVGEDGSVRYALQVDDEVVVDVRAGTDADDDRTDPLSPVRATYQAMVDLDRVAALAEELSPSDGGDSPGLDALDAGGLADARAQIDALRSQVLLLVPDAAPLLDLVTAALDGELVEVTGTLDPRAWLESAASVAGTDPATLEDELGAALDAPTPGEAPRIDPAELYAAMFAFDDFRTDDGATLVDMSIELRRGGEALLSQLDEWLVDDADGLGGAVGELREDLDRLRAALREAPERLEDVGTLRFGPDGELQQARLDLLDVAAEVAAAVEPDDPDVALLADAAADLERTGVFMTLDVAGVGDLPTVLGDASTSVTWDELQQVVDSLAGVVGGLLGGLALGAGDALAGSADDLADGDLGDAGDLGGLLDGAALGLRPDEVPVGACFDDGDLFTRDDTATTVPCDGPHDNEAFAVLELGGPADPFDPDVVLAASSLCDEPFEQYVGTPYVESAFFHATITPTRAEWEEDGLRTGVCYLFAFEPQVGSAAGSGR